MIFILDPLVVELSSPAQYPAGYDYTLVQAKDKSASGITHVESYSVRSNIKSYSFVDMSYEDYQLLLNFFINSAEGMLNTFQLWDDLGNVSTVRFADSMLHFDATSYGCWSGSFRVEEII